MLIDTHAHLNDPRYDGETDKIISGLSASGVGLVINVSYDRASSEKAVDLAAKYPQIFAAPGIHPHDAQFAAPADYDYFKNLCRENPKVAAVGETGLDYHYMHSPKERQQQEFLNHIALAREVDLPLIIHCREAYGDLTDILRRAGTLRSGGVVHCYSGSLESAKIFWDMGLYLSFGGAITYKNARVALEVLTAAPRDRIMLETDCPYMTPEPHRGKTNYPEYIGLVAEKLAEVWGVAVGKVAEITTQNALTLFKRLKSGSAARDF